MKSKKRFVKNNFKDGDGHAGFCPVCGQSNLEYGNPIPYNDNLFYPWTCKSCGSNGREMYYVEFIGHHTC